MPLYTYVTIYKGASHTVQARRSNPSGFADWLEAMPATLRKQVCSPYAGFEPIPNRRKAWMRREIIEGSELIVIAVQTAD